MGIAAVAGASVLNKSTGTASSSDTHMGRQRHAPEVRLGNRLRKQLATSDGKTPGDKTEREAGWSGTGPRHPLLDAPGESL